MGAYSRCALIIGWALIRTNTVAPFRGVVFSKPWGPNQPNFATGAENKMITGA